MAQNYTSTTLFLENRGNVGTLGGGGGLGCCRPANQMSLNDAVLGNYATRHQQQQKDDVVILTEGFDKISVKERDQALAELHGVIDKVEENPTIIETSLQQLEVEISKVKKNRTAYDKAVFLSPHYVKDQDFRLMFLRCEKYDIKKAAVRIIKHFEIKLELFGYQCLGRDITYDDLEYPNSVDMLMSAQSWFLNKYDRSGRRLFLICGERVFYTKPINFLQFSWYITMNALEDIQTQINGATMIIFCIGETLRKPVDVPSVLQYPKLLASIPINWAGIHYCYEDKVAAKMFPNPITLAQLAVDTMTRIKFRTHHGSAVEMKYTLVSYGIPSEYLPLDSSGMLMDDEFKQQISKRRTREVERRQRLVSSNIIEHPTHLDVLLGRGKPYQDFPGNVRLNQMVELRKPSYEAASWTEKTAAAIEIVETLHGMGGRFLRRRGGAGVGAGKAGGSGGGVDGESNINSSSKKDGDDDEGGGSNGNSSTVTIEDFDSECLLSSWEEVEFAVARKKVVNCFQFRKRATRS